MPFRSVVLALALLCSACDETSTTDAADGVAPAITTTTEGSAERAPPALDGDWQVASIDGRSVTGITLSASNNTLRWGPDCARMSVGFQQNGTAISFVSNRPKNGEITTVCRIGYPQSVPKILQLMPAFDSISTEPDGKVKLAGGGHYVRLERPKDPSEYSVPTLKGRWRVSAVDGDTLSSGVPLILEANDSWIAWEVECARQGRSYYIESDRFTAAVPPDSPPPPPDVNVPSPPICAIGLPPNLGRVLTALDEVSVIAPGANGSVLLTGNGHAVRLSPVSHAE